MLKTDTVGFDEVIAAMRRRIWLMIGLPLTAAMIAYAASFLLQPKYRVEVVLLPQSGDAQQGLLGSMGAQFGGLASMAGLDLGAMSNKVEAIEVLRSRSLAEEFIKDRNLLPLLFAADWDADRQTWRSAQSGDAHSLADGVRMLDETIRGVSEDRRTGVVTLTITWHDRIVAANWANDLVRRANKRMQTRTIEESRRTLQFLLGKADAQESVAVREALFKVVESQVKSMALASVREDFAFRVIDPASPPDADDTAFPRRAVFAAAGGLLGVILAWIWLLLGLRRRPSVVA
jgi:uncharacterized protein involved in exopolysaccharide biosynthesis